MTTDEDFGTSWYCAALARELAPGRNKTGAFCGRSLRLRASTDGLVTATLAERPVPVRVHDEVIFVWHDPAGGPPRYELPILDDAGFTPRTFDFLDVQTSPALVMRDLADDEHFETVHRYRRVSIDEPFYVDGARCGLAFSFDWPLILGSRVLTVRVQVRSMCCGLGYQRTTVSTLGGAMMSRHLVLPTPTEGANTRVTLGMDVRFQSVLSTLPTIAPLGHAFARRAFARDVAADAANWQALATTPAKAEGAHGPLATFWSWADQFRAFPMGATCARGEV
jgi:hypothetical protein